MESIILNTTNFGVINKQCFWSYLPTPPLGQDMTQGQFLSEVQQVWIQSFPSPRLVFVTKAEEPSLSNYLPIAGGRIIGFIPFPRVLVQCEMQSVSSRFWTRVAVYNSYDDNHYSMCNVFDNFFILLPSKNVTLYVGTIKRSQEIKIFPYNEKELRNKIIEFFVLQ